MQDKIGTYSVIRFPTAMQASAYSQINFVKLSKTLLYSMTQQCTARLSFMNNTVSLLRTFSVQYIASLSLYSILRVSFSKLRAFTSQHTIVQFNSSLYWSEFTANFPSAKRHCAEIRIFAMTLQSPTKWLSAVAALARKFAHRPSSVTYTHFKKRQTRINSVQR